MSSFGSNDFGEKKYGTRQINFFFEYWMTLKLTHGLVNEDSHVSEETYEDTILSEDYFTCIGRAASAHITVDDVQVSGKHCIVRLDNEGGVVIEDTSRNGTFYNGNQIVENVTLQVGECFTLLSTGTHRHRFSVAVASEDDIATWKTRTESKMNRKRKGKDNLEKTASKKTAISGVFATIQEERKQHQKQLAAVHELVQNVQEKSTRKIRDLESELEGLKTLLKEEKEFSLQEIVKLEARVTSELNLIHSKQLESKDVIIKELENKLNADNDLKFQVVALQSEASRNAELEAEVARRKTELKCIEQSLRSSVEFHTNVCDGLEVSLQGFIQAFREKLAAEDSRNLNLLDSVLGPVSGDQEDDQEEDLVESDSSHEDDPSESESEIRGTQAGSQASEIQETYMSPSKQKNTKERKMSVDSDKEVNSKESDNASSDEDFTKV